MRIYLLIILAAIINGCSSNRSKLSRDSLLTECQESHERMVGEMGYELYTTEEAAKLCECVADKMISKYKSEAELENDSLGAKQLARECLREKLNE